MKQLYVWLGIVCLLCVSAGAQTPVPQPALSLMNIFTDVPQFSGYSSTVPPNYTAPPGILLLPQWITLVKLTPAQQQMLGSDLSAQVTKIAGCDVFDRTGGIIFLTMPPGQTPTVSDLPNAITMAHFQTPFTFYNGSNTTYVFPLVDIRQYAPFLADTTHDIWVGINGGSNPMYPDGPSQYNPCWDSNDNQVPNLPVAPYPPGLTTAQGQAIFALTGFSYSLDLAWTQPAVAASTASAVNAFANVPSGSTTVPTPVSYYTYKVSALPITGTITVPTPSDGSTTVLGTISVAIDSHGGNAEFLFNPASTMTVNGTLVGQPFSTEANCPPYLQYSPNGNPGLFNPAPANARSWCPGAPLTPTFDNPGTPFPTATNYGTPMQDHLFSNVLLNAGSNTFTLDMGTYVGINPINSGDAYKTSINFAPFAPQAGIATTTTLTASASSSAYGQAVTYTATVVPAAGNPVPAGSVQFINNGSVLGTSAVDGNGVATLTTNATAAGSVTMVALFTPALHTYQNSFGTLPHTTSQGSVPLTATIIGTPSKFYDGGTVAVLVPANYQLTGFVGTDGATVTQPVGAYAAAAVGAEQVTAMLTASNFQPNIGTNLSNYVLPASASGPGQILPSVMVNTASDSDNPGLPAQCNSGNANTCTLRDAMAAIAASSTGSGSIGFDPTVFATPQTIHLGYPGLATGSKGTLMIAGPGVANLTLDGGGNNTVFTNNANTTISGLTVTNAAGFFAAGAITNSGGSLTLNGVNIIGNNSSYGDAGAIYSSAPLVVLNSTIANNSGAPAGGLYIAGGSSATVINSTISGNSGAFGFGGGSPVGGIYNNGSVLTLINSTITGNTADGGFGGDPAGGIYNSNGSVTLINSTITGNGVTSGKLPGGIYTTGGTVKAENNIIAGNTSLGSAPDYSGFTPDTTNITSATGLSLAPLGNYGGPTQTLIPLLGSTAICAGLVANAVDQNQAPLTTDQRGTGYPRTTSYANTPCVDAGAVQTNYALSFTTQPVDTLIYQPITPAPAVQVTESHVPFAYTGASIALAFGPGSTGNLTGTTTAATNAQGLATFAGLSGDTAGTGDTLVATLGSGATALTATSTAFSITPIVTSATVTSSLPTSTYGQPVTFTATVSTAGAAAPAGSVQFSVDGAPLGAPVTQVNGVSVSAPTSALTAGTHTVVAVFTPASGNYGTSQGSVLQTVNLAQLTVVANNASRVYGAANPSFSGTITGQQNGDTFTESFTTTATTASNAGTYPIVPAATGVHAASYAQVITNGTLTITQAASNTMLSVSSASINPGASVTLTASVVSTTSGVPTGSVSFYDGTTLLNKATLVAGSASISTTALTPAISNALTVVYAGDQNFSGSRSSAPINVTVGALDFTFAVQGQSQAQPVVYGATASFAFSLAPLYGAYPQAVTFTATGLPAGATASFSPSSVAANGGAQTITMTVQTAPATSMNMLGRGLAPVALGLLLLPIFGVGRGAGRRRRLNKAGGLLLLVLLGTAATIGISGCVGGNPSSKTQNYNIVVTASSGSIQHTATVAVTTVQFK